MKNNHLTMKKINLILLALPFLLFSCDSVDELLSTGQFDSKITGSITKDFNGEAAFAHIITVDGTPQSSSLTIALSTIESQSESIALGLNEEGNIDGIAAGTYNYDAAGSIFFPIYSKDQALWYPDGSLTNKVVLSSVGGTIVKGTFELNLNDDITLQGEKIKIVGTFSAVGTTKTE